MRIEQVVAVLVVVAVHADGINADVDMFDVRRLETMLLTQCQQAVNRRMVMPAAGIGLEAVLEDAPVSSQPVEEELRAHFTPLVKGEQPRVAFQNSPPLLLHNALEKRVLCPEVRKRRTFLKELVDSLDPIHRLCPRPI